MAKCKGIVMTSFTVFWGLKETAPYSDTHQYTPTAPSIVTCRKTGTFAVVNSIKNLSMKLFYCYLIYEGESNENLKSAIKILNTARLSFKLATMILMS